MLPRSYYLRISTIDVSLSLTAPTSMFNRYDFKIIIAFKNILEAVKGKEECDDYTLEVIVRGLLYHELSHAILTPKIEEYYPKHYKEYPYLTYNIINILEDERIENILSKYYYSVDFKENVRRINSKVDPVRNFEDYLLNVVRLRLGDFVINSRINQFIEETKHISATYENIAGLLAKMNRLAEYLYIKYKENYNPKEGSYKIKEVIIDRKEIEDLISRTIREIKKESNQDITINDFIGDPNLKNDLLGIIYRRPGVGIERTNVTYGLSGKFNVKRYMKDFHQTYKWFERPVVSGNAYANRGEKKVLNIFLDQSGSFESSHDKINEILRTLVDIEKSRSDFTFNLIRVADDIGIEENKEHRYSHESYGGENALPVSKWREIYSKLNKTGREFNIVLFDGYAITVPSDDPIGNSFLALRSFDNKKSIFIIEESNVDGIRNWCPSAKDIIIENSDYSRRLKENVKKALRVLFG